MSKVQAWERLKNPEYCRDLDMVQLYELILEAGYTEKIAEKAASNRGWERLTAGEKV